jgi:OMF family outer membrane factor
MNLLRNAGRIFAAAFLAALMALAGAASAQVARPLVTALPSPLTLSQAINIALRHQPQAFVSKDQVTQAAGQKQEAESQYFPILTPSYQYQDHSTAAYGEATQINQSTGSQYGGGSSINEVTITRGGGAAVGLSETLFDSGARELANAEARHNLQSANDSLADTRQDIVLAITQDYYNLLEALDIVKVAQAQVDRYQQTLDLTKAEVEAKVSAQIDVYSAQSDLATAQVTLLQDQNNVITATATLKDELGAESDTPVQPQLLAPADQLPPIPASRDVGTLDQNIATAYTSRQDLQAQAATVQANDAAVKAAEVQAGLSFTATATANYQATNDIGYRGLDTEILLTGSYPLFDAGKSRGAVRVAQGQRDSSINQFVSERESVRANVEEAYATRQIDYSAAKLADAAVKASQVSYDAAVASMKEGVDTILDVTTAQATLTQSQDQYVVAIYNYYVADAALQRAIGQNDTYNVR